MWGRPRTAAQLVDRADLAGGKGRPARLVVVHPLPEDWGVLPAPEYVEKEMRGELHAKRPALDTTEDQPPASADFGSDERAASHSAEGGAPAVDTPSNVHVTETAKALERPAEIAPPTAQPLAPIIANAPRPDQPDGGYRSRRAMNEFRSMMARIQSGRADVRGPATKVPDHDS